MVSKNKSIWLLSSFVASFNQNQKYLRFFNRPSDISIYTLEQCPTQWKDFKNCVRLVYAIPVKMDASCSLWKGYQMNEEHLNLMWVRLSPKFLKDGFSVYEQPEIKNLVLWWIICMAIVILMLAGATISINLMWKRRQYVKRWFTKINSSFLITNIYF